jgi:hypothetical protein
MFFDNFIQGKFEAAYTDYFGLECQVKSWESELHRANAESRKRMRDINIRSIKNGIDLVFVWHVVNLIRIAYFGSALKHLLLSA